MAMQDAGREGCGFPAIDSFSSDASAAVAALYLRGLPRMGEPLRRRWPQIESCLRRENATLSSCVEALSSAGFWHEAAVLQSPGLLSLAERLVQAGRCLTAVSPAYPSQWRQRLGPLAPPALWQAGSAPSGPYCCIVGSRLLSAAGARFAREASLAVSQAGGAVLSGGAHGADRTAARAASAAIEIWPCGIESDPRPVPPSVGWVLSVCAPSEGFTAAAAFERNALLYAGAQRSLVAAAQHKAGGTWGGAVEALRRRLGPIFVREASEGGLAALCALGGIPLADPHLFPAAEAVEAQPALLS